MDEQQLQQQIVQLVQAAMQGDQQATQQIQQIMQAAQQGDPQAAQIAQMIQQVAQQMQSQQVQAAKFGAKLNYIRQLQGQCPEGYQMEYFKKGGQLCKRCMKKEQGGNMSYPTLNSVSEQFKMEAAKCGKKMKKKACGGDIESKKCGGKPKLKKKACGGPVQKKKITKAEGGTDLELNPIASRNAQAREENRIRRGSAAAAWERFKDIPSIPNLLEAGSKAVSAWLFPENEHTEMLTGTAPMPSTTSPFSPKVITNVRDIWNKIRQAGKWGTKPAFKPGYRGTKPYSGGYGAQQGNVFLPNNAKIGGGPSNAAELEEEILKELEQEAAKGMYSEYQLQKTINQRLNNLYRLSDEDISDMKQFAGGDFKLFRSRLLQLLKGHSGRVRQGTR